MGCKGNIRLYRDILDKTLASEELTNEETLKTLVKNQLLSSSRDGFEEHIDNVVAQKTKELSYFLEMQRSASAENLKLNDTPGGAWKVKQDTDELRVMYREGPEGTPFHTLLAEGYIDGPLDSCLCISYEAGLYKKWWPRLSVPTFKITSAKCLEKIRTGEQISSVRMKLSWPLSVREAIISYFVFEYVQEGLIIVLVNSISDVDIIKLNNHRETSNGNDEDVVIMDVVGGFALQKVTATRSYFRNLGNIDIKLDIVPPAFINFLSRQVIGSGFKLYKKAVASVSQGDDDFNKALKDPLYEGIRKSLYSDNISSQEIKNHIIKEKFVFRDEKNQHGIDEIEVEDTGKVKKAK